MCSSDLIVDLHGLPGNIGIHCRILRDAQLRRAMIEAARSIEASAYETDTEAGDLVAEAQLHVRQAADSAFSAKTTGAREAVAAWSEHIERLRESPDGVTGIRSGIDALDRHTTGAQPGWLVVICAHSEMGKTAFALNNYGLNCLKSGKDLLVVSYEMSVKGLGGRLIAAWSGVPSHIQRSTAISADDARKYQTAKTKVEELPFHFIDAPLPDARAAAMRLPNLGAIIVDYLQLAPPIRSGRGVTREQELASVSRYCKRELARGLGVPVFLLSQPDKASSTQLPSGEWPRLTPSSSKGAQATQADADLMLFPRRPFKDSPDVDKRNKAEVNDGKDRHNGGRLFTGLRWNGARMRYEEHGASGLVQDRWQ